MRTLDSCPDLKERLQVLLQQECTNYRCRDYLKQPPQVSASASSPVDQGLNSTETAWSELYVVSPLGANEVWREKICKWTYEVVDHFDFNREIVSISLSYLDRFLSSRQVNHKTFQLAAMTTLYLAIKLYEPKKLKISSLIELSRGYFRVEHIAAMEKFILRDLCWRVHPPTPQCFARHIFEHPLFKRSSFDIDTRQEMIDLSHFFMELSVCDYFFVTRMPSSIAVASIFNALDGVATSFPSCRATLATIKRGLKHFSKELGSWSEVEECRKYLRGMYFQAMNNQHDCFEFGSSVEERSPTCVSSTISSANTHAQSHENKPRKTSKTQARSSPSCGGRDKKRLE